MTEPTNETENTNGSRPAYAPIGRWSMGLGHRTYLGDETLIKDKHRRVCRFCGQTTPAVTFNKEAHVVPQLLANRSLLSVYECDVCNEKFGVGIEHDLGNWTKPYRTVMLVPGQRGVPTVKGAGADPWRIEGTGRELNVTARRDNMPYEVDEEKRLIPIELLRDPYTPAAVMKAFVRVGLTLMPEDELVHFPKLMAWIQNPDHRTVDVGRWSWVYETRQPVSVLDGEVRAGLYRREHDEGLYPYMFLIVAFSNHLYQVPLISAARDAHLHEKDIVLPPFPIPTSPELAQCGPSVRTLIDLNGTEVVKGEMVKINLSYGERKEVTGINP